MCEKEMDEMQLPPPPRILPTRSASSKMGNQRLPNLLDTNAPFVCRFSAREGPTFTKDPVAQGILEGSTLAKKWYRYQPVVSLPKITPAKTEEVDVDKDSPVPQEQNLELKKSRKKRAEESLQLNSSPDQPLKKRRKSTTVWAHLQDLRKIEKAHGGQPRKGRSASTGPRQSEGSEASSYSPKGVSILKPNVEMSKGEQYSDDSDGAVPQLESNIGQINTQHLADPSHERVSQPKLSAEKPEAKLSSNGAVPIVKSNAKMSEAKQSSSGTVCILKSSAKMSEVQKSLRIPDGAVSILKTNLKKPEAGPSPNLSNGAASILKENLKSREKKSPETLDKSVSALKQDTKKSEADSSSMRDKEAYTLKQKLKREVKFALKPLLKKAAAGQLTINCDDKEHGESLRGNTSRASTSQAPCATKQNIEVIDLVDSPPRNVSNLVLQQRIQPAVTSGTTPEDSVSTSNIPAPKAEENGSHTSPIQSPERSKLESLGVFEFTACTIQEKKDDLSISELDQNLRSIVQDMISSVGEVVDEDRPKKDTSGKKSESKKGVAHDKPPQREPHGPRKAKKRFLDSLRMRRRGLIKQEAPKKGGNGSNNVKGNQKREAPSLKVANKRSKNFVKRKMPDAPPSRIQPLNKVLTVRSLKFDGKQWQESSSTNKRPEPSNDGKKKEEERVYLKTVLSPHRLLPYQCPHHTSLSDRFSKQQSASVHHKEAEIEGQDQIEIIASGARPDSSSGTLRKGKKAEVPAPQRSASHQKLLEFLQREESVSLEKPEVGNTVMRLRSSSRIEGSLPYANLALRKYQNFIQIILNSTTTSLMNAFDAQTLEELTEVLNTLAAVDSVKMVLFTSAGSTFCQGIDIPSLLIQDFQNRRCYIKRLISALRSFLSALISFPKTLVAAVHGSAIGLGATILPFFNLVYASDKAWFYTPYSALRQRSEGGACISFKDRVGALRAQALLVFGVRFTAEQMFHKGFITEVIVGTSPLLDFIMPKLQSWMSNDSEGILKMKQEFQKLNHDVQSAVLMEVPRECQKLEEDWMSPDFQTAAERFLSDNQDLLRLQVPHQRS
ncbi:unnamed protein product [Darwinula stevensoni]|uniref:Uncharacterized protein n=1 Tax=Darwinula stevensoni TaxID=69355 RepID=A0A7R8XB97_9CRUS|nr:unnamed protein product [Darwinula stevensoni]CAG0886390.1 unnamed protein product [Darwinula stevensoni]